MDAAARGTNALIADGEVVWSWHPDADAKFVDDDLASHGGKKARLTGESTKETGKTIARGMPEFSR